MAFSSWQQFWAMGGYGLYVWLSFAVTLVLVTGMVIFHRIQHRRLVRAIGQQQQRRQRIADAQLKQQDRV